MRTEYEVSIPTHRDSGWVVFRNCLSLLLVWTLICGTAAPRVEAAGHWLIELTAALLSTPDTEQLDTPTDAVISRTRPTLNCGRIEGNLRVLKAEAFSIGAQTHWRGSVSGLLITGVLSKWILRSRRSAGQVSNRNLSARQTGV